MAIPDYVDSFWWDISYWDSSNPNRSQPGFDYKLDFTGKVPEMTFEKTPSIINNIFLSLTIIRGTFFQNLNFGIRAFPKVKTDTTINVVKQYIEEALQWLFDAGKITGLDILVENDIQNINRINFSGKAVQTSGLLISFGSFVEVI